MSVKPYLAVLALIIFSSCGEEPVFTENVERYAYSAEEADDHKTADAHAAVEDSDGEANELDTGGSAGNDSDQDSAGDHGNTGTNDDDSTTDEDGLGDDSPEVIDKLKRLPKFGLLVNDLECGFCHVSVIGDIVSTRRVPPLWSTSNAHLTGKWLAADTFDANQPECSEPHCRGQGVTINATGGIHPQYLGKELPLDLNKDSHPDFPTLDFAAVKSQMRGRVMVAGSVLVDKVHTGNLLLEGTATDPIEITDDVYIEGDLIIKGAYRGVGSIYVTGNIYIPADLTAQRSAFPFADDAGAALEHANTLIAAQNTDALGLASQNSIFIGDLEKQQNSDAGNETVNVYNHPSTPPDRRAEALGVYAVYDWFPGGKAGYDGLYENAINCQTGLATQIGSFNMIESFLYARNTVAGISRRASYTIRGGIIADFFHIVSGAVHCDGSASAIHGRPDNRSYVEYDYRLKTGRLRILEHIGHLFPKQDSP